MAKIIEVRPTPQLKGAWSVNKGRLGVAPFFMGVTAKHSAISFAREQLPRGGEVHVVDASGKVETVIIKSR